MRNGVIWWSKPWIPWLKILLLVLPLGSWVNHLYSGFLICSFFLRFNLFIWGRGSMSRGRQRRVSPNRLPNECGAWLGLDLRTLRSWPEPKSKVRHTTDWATQAPWCVLKLTNLENQIISVEIHTKLIFAINASMIKQTKATAFYIICSKTNLIHRVMNWEATLELFHKNKDDFFLTKS